MVTAEVQPDNKSDGTEEDLEHEYLDFASKEEKGQDKKGQDK